MAKDWDIRLLYERHRTEMLRLASCLLGDEEEGRDAVSEVFAQLAEPHPLVRYYCHQSHRGWREFAPQLRHSYIPI